MDAFHTKHLSSNVRDLSSLQHFVAEARAYLNQPITSDTAELLTHPDFPHRLVEPSSSKPPSVGQLAKDLKTMMDPSAEGNPASFKRGIAYLCEILAVRAVDGEEGAATTLVDAATLFAVKVKELSLKQPELFRSLARQRCEWPSVISFHRDWELENEEIIKASELGAEHPLSKMKKISKRAARLQQTRQVLHVTANRLVDLVEATRQSLQRFVLPKESWSHKKGSRKTTLDDVERMAGKTLPHWMVDASYLDALSKSNAKMWFNVGWVAIYDLMNERPEELPRLKEVGEYRRMRRKDAGGGKGTRETNVREGVKIQLRKAFLTRFGK